MNDHADKLDAALEQIAALQVEVANLTRTVETIHSWDKSASEAHVGREEDPIVWPKGAIVSETA